ncbi:MAG TPA: zf-HC2 domain-containing protein [Candidatus Acidoferrales bacterium]|nr:zf-HC2 domain-containing protein [Candidatus Acidoferrales bacterium]
MNCSDIAELAPLYIAGELAPRRAAEFDVHLKTCPACMRELEEQARLDGRLREIVLADKTDVARVDRRVRESIAARPEAGTPASAQWPMPRRWAIAAMGIAAGFLVFGLGYYFMLGTRVARVYADAAADHRMEVVEQQPRPAWLVDPAEISALAKQHGIPGSEVLALASEGYHLERGRMCGLDNRAFLHLVYSDGTREFSVYLRLRDAERLPGAIRETVSGKPLRTCDLGSEHIASFETPRVTALVVADGSAEDALHFARLAAAAL